MSLRFKLVILFALIASILVSQDWLFVRSRDDPRLIDLSQELAIKSAILSYKAHFKAFPSGSSSSIISQLSGDNPDNHKFIDIKSFRLNSSGDIMGVNGNVIKIFILNDNIIIK